MKSTATFFAAGFVLGLFATAALLGEGGRGAKVVDTPHNLSVSGPGSVKSRGETEVCVFCHAPHTQSPQTPLWNRPLGAQHYELQPPSPGSARHNRPPGRDSRLCLSCHDGTVALGMVGSRDEPIPMHGGDRLTGSSLLGADLTDDHPVSFAYDAALLDANPELRPRAELEDAGLRLIGEEGSVECTTCHSAHANRHGAFLLASAEGGRFCMNCHAPDGWALSVHASAPGSWTTPPPARWSPLVGRDLPAMGCNACHRTHNAAGRGLGYAVEEEENCLVCHDGRMADAGDIRRELDKLSRHDPRRTAGLHAGREEGGGMDHVECTDCHDPHAMQAAGSSAGLPGALAGARGANADGQPVPRVTRSHQVCFRCHASGAVSGGPGITTDPSADLSPGSGIRRLWPETDVGRKFLSENASFHPVTAPSPNSGVPGLRDPAMAGGLIECIDCHNNDEGPRAGGPGPSGPHGSRHPFLLERAYQRLDLSPESPLAYALCYKCHDRDTLLGPGSGFPAHRAHVVDRQTPCTACHDPHGVAAGFSLAGTHLINFDLDIVAPASTGDLGFEDLGFRRGSCTLSCHEADHVTKTYGK